MTTYSGFVDGSIRYTLNLASMAWVLYSPNGDLVLTYDQKYDKLGGGKLESMWHGPYIVNCVLEKGAYELIDYDGIPLGETRNGIYLNM